MSGGGYIIPTNGLDDSSIIPFPVSDIATDSKFSEVSGCNTATICFFFFIQRTRKKTKFEFNRNC